MNSKQVQEFASKEVSFQRAVVLHEQNRLDEAEGLYRAILKEDPADIGSLHNLGILHIQQGKYHDAIELVREILRHQPDLAVAHYSLGVALRHLGRLEEAEVCCREALRLAPDYVEAHNTLADTLTALGRYGEAEACCRAALRLKPEYAEAHYNLGTALMSLRRPAEAERSYREALLLKPENPAAFHNLGNALMHQGKLGEASAAFGRAAALNPNNADALANWFHLKQRICDWSDYPESEARFRNGLAAAASPNVAFRLLGTGAPAEEQLACARRIAAKFAVPKADLLSSSLPTSPRARIRIGYLSSDFQALPTAFLSVGIFEHHDRGRFDIIGYSAYPDDGSAIRQRLAQAFDRFVDVSGLSDARAAQVIHADGLDVLVGLDGLTPYARPKILAYRPAPIQLNYLGYTGTIGADFIDYIIVDRFVVAPEQQPFFAERLVHLPDCYQCNDDKREISPATPSRAACGLPERAFVFCCFNDSYKITPGFFDIWMRLLRAVPGSVIWLGARQTIVKASLAREAAARSIAPERLVFAERLPLLSEHLARHRVADLFLDTLPFNAHTTASDALWAGLPVLTCAGTTFAGRVAGSLLQAIGLAELVTTSLEEYEALALRLVREPELLARLRARLAENRLSFPLFDTARSTRALEAAYERMCAIRKAGRVPTAFSVSPSRVFHRSSRSLHPKGHAGSRLPSSPSHGS
jgi:protein O-GlcNAc transferase